MELPSHDERLTPAVETVLAALARELPQLMMSGENWQVVLHGGRGGDVILEIKRTRTLVPTHAHRQGSKRAE